MSNGSGAVNLGSAYGELLIDTSKVETSLNKAFKHVEDAAEGAMSRVGARIQAAGDKLSGWGTSLTKLTAPIALLGGAGVKAFMNLDDALTEVQARTGATADEMQKVRDKALALGGAYGGPARVTEAMLQLLASGYDINQTFEALTPILDAAAASGMDLGVAADAVTDILAMFNLEAKDAGIVSDILAKAAGASSAEIGDLMEGFGNVGPIANQFGLDVEEVAAILAIFAENGVKGAEAGTQLKSMLTTMSSPTKQVQETWAALGISLFDAYGAVRPLPAVMGELSKKLATMTDKERIQTTQALAGSFGQIGATILTSNMSIDEMIGLMDKQASAADVAKAKLGSLRGIITRIKSTIEVFLLNALSPVIEDGLKPFAEQVITVLEKLNEWILANPELTNQIVKFLAIMVATGPALIIVGKAIALIGVLVSALANPLVWIGALVAALALAWEKDFLGIRSAMKPVGKTIKYIMGWLKKAYAVWEKQGGIIEGVVGAIEALFYVFEDGKTTFFSKLFESFGMSTEKAQQLGLKIVELATKFMSVLGPAVQRAKEWLINAFTAVSNFIVDRVLPVLGMVAEWFLTDALPTLINFLTTAVIPLIERFFNFIGSAWEIVSPSLSKFYDWFVTTALPAVLNFISGTAIPALTDLFQAIGEGWDYVAPYLLKFLDWFVNDALPVVVAFITDEFVPVIEKIFNAIRDAWNWAEPYLVKFYNWFVTEALPVVIAFITDDVVPAVESIFNAIRDVWNWAEPYLQKLYNWFVTEALPWIVNAIETVLMPVLAGIWQGIQDVWTFAEPWLTKLYDWFVTTGGPAIRDFIKDILLPYLNDIWKTIQDVWDFAEPWLNKLEDWWVNGGGKKIGESLAPGSQIIKGLNLFKQSVKDLHEDTVDPRGKLGKYFAEELPDSVEVSKRTNESFWVKLPHTIDRSVTQIKSHLSGLSAFAAGRLNVMNRDATSALNSLTLTLAKWGLELIKALDFVAPSLTTVLNSLDAFLTEFLNSAWVTVAAFYEVGKAIITGIWNGIKAKWDEVKPDVDKFWVDSLVAGAKLVLEAFSPSHVFIRIGESVIDGLTNGLSSASSLLALGLQMLAVLAIVTGTGLLISDAGTNAGTNFITNLTNAINLNAYMISGAMGIVQTYASGLAQTMTTAGNYAGQMLVYGIATGIYNNISAAVYAIQYLGYTLQAALQQALKIASPSKVFEKLGGFIPEGLAEGISSKAASALTAMNGLALSLTPVIPEMAYAGGAGTNSYSTVDRSLTQQITIAITPDTIRQYPNATNYADQVKRVLEESANKQGGGIAR